MRVNKKRITLDCKVDSYRSGWTVVEFLAHRFKYHPRERWTERVNDGRVRINGEAVTPEHQVSEHDVVCYTIFHDEPEVDFRHDIVYEDDDLLAVSKSGNLPVHACGVYIRHTLIAHVKNRLGDHINLAHRLDRETSGLVLLCKNPVAARGLSSMFADGLIAKTYLAVVHGRIDRGRFEVDAPIGKTEDVVPVAGERETMRGVESDLREDFPRLVPKRVVDFDNGKPATTVFRVLKTGTVVTVLEVKPLSGRTNQIRVHLDHIGHPLVGDKVYRPVGDPVGQPTMKRHALHCRQLVFEHPVTGAPMNLCAEIPEDMTALLRHLD